MEGPCRSDGSRNRSNRPAPRRQGDREKRETGRDGVVLDISREEHAPCRSQCHSEHRGAGDPRPAAGHHHGSCQLSEHAEDSRDSERAPRGQAQRHHAATQQVVAHLQGGGSQDWHSGFQIPQPQRPVTPQVERGWMEQDCGQTGQDADRNTRPRPGCMGCSGQHDETCDDQWRNARGYGQPPRACRERQRQCCKGGEHAEPGRGGGQTPSPGRKPAATHRTVNSAGPACPGRRQHISTAEWRLSSGLLVQRLDRAPGFAVERQERRAPDEVIVGQRA